MFYMRSNVTLLFAKMYKNLPSDMSTFWCPDSNADTSRLSAVAYFLFLSASAFWCFATSSFCNCIGAGE